MRGEVSCDTALDESASDDVVLGRVLVSLQHDPRCDSLEEVFPKEWLRLGRCEVADLARTLIVLAEVFSATSLHVVDD
jgi:hypothetical protein